MYTVWEAYKKERLLKTRYLILLQYLNVIRWVELFFSTPVPYPTTTILPYLVILYKTYIMCSTRTYLYIVRDWFSTWKISQQEIYWIYCFIVTEYLPDYNSTTERSYSSARWSLINSILIFSSFSATLSTIV